MPNSYYGLQRNPPPLLLGKTKTNEPIRDATYREYDYSPGVEIRQKPLNKRNHPYFPHEDPTTNLYQYGVPASSEGDQDDFTPSEKQVMESVLQQTDEQALDNFIQRLNKYRRLRTQKSQNQRQI